MEQKVGDQGAEQEGQRDEEAHPQHDRHPLVRRRREGEVGRLHLRVGQGSPTPRRIVSIASAATTGMKIHRIVRFRRPGRTWLPT